MSRQLEKLVGNIPPKEGSQYLNLRFIHDDHKYLAGFELEEGEPYPDEAKCPDHPGKTGYLVKETYPPVSYSKTGKNSSLLFRR